jgi:hypothetical protein
MSKSLFKVTKSNAARRRVLTAIVWTLSCVSLASCRGRAERGKHDGTASATGDASVGGSSSESESAISSGATQSTTESSGASLSGSGGQALGTGGDATGGSGASGEDGGSATGGAGGEDGNSATGGAGGSGGRGTSTSCPVCEGGSLCVRVARTSGPATQVDYLCADDPCAPDPLDCECARSVCESLLESEAATCTLGPQGAARIWCSAGGM